MYNELLLKLFPQSSPGKDVAHYQFIADHEEQQQGVGVEWPAPASFRWILILPQTGKESNFPGTL